MLLAVPHVLPVTDAPFKTLADFTSPALIVPHLENHVPAALISGLCSLLQEGLGLSDSDAFCDAVIARELMSPTAISPGFALPHARLAGLPQLCFALARSSRPLTWFVESSVQVQVIFLFAVPEAQAKMYLNVISAVAKLSQNPALVRELMRAPDSRAVLEVLKQAPLRQPGSATRPKFNVLSIEAEYPVV
jgi:PTS system nitrogen regulatory IIA component